MSSEALRYSHYERTVSAPCRDGSGPLHGLRVDIWPQKACLTGVERTTKRFGGDFVIVYIQYMANDGSLKAVVIGCLYSCAIDTVLSVLHEQALDSVFR